MLHFIETRGITQNHLIDSEQGKNQEPTYILAKHWDTITTLGFDTMRAIFTFVLLSEYMSLTYLSVWIECLKLPNFVDLKIPK